MLISSINKPYMSNFKLKIFSIYSLFIPSYNLSDVKYSILSKIKHI